MSKYLETTISNDFKKEIDALPEEKQNIGIYNLDRKIRTTKQNLIYLGRTDQGASVAIKISRSSQPSIIKAHAREAHIQEDMSVLSPFIVPVENHGLEELRFPRGQSGIDGYFPYMVTPFFDEETMDVNISDPSVDRKTLFRKGLLTAGLAIDAFGEKGRIINRDIKPPNVFMRNGAGYVTDFGIAVSHGKEVNRDGKAYGSPLYLPPEQVKPNVRLGHETNVWGGAALALKLIDGKPFMQNGVLHDGVELFWEIMDSPEQYGRYLNTRLSGLPIPVQDVLRESLSYFPNDRPSLFMKTYTSLERAIEHPKSPTFIFASESIHKE